MNVTGKTKVFAKTFSNGNTAYSRQVAFKDNQGDWHNIFEPITFKGGDPSIPNKTEIEVINGFESGYMDNNGNAQRKLVVMEWEITDAPSGFAELAEDVPF